MMWFYLLVFLPLCVTLWFWGVGGVVTGGRVVFASPGMLVGLPSLSWCTFIFWPRVHLHIPMQWLSLWIFCSVQLVYTCYLQSLYMQWTAMMWFYLLPLCVMLWFWGVGGVVTGGRVGLVLPGMLAGLPSFSWCTFIFWARVHLHIPMQWLSLWIFCSVQLVYTGYLQSLYIQWTAMMWFYLLVFLLLCVTLWFWGVGGVVTGGRVVFASPGMLVELPSLLWCTFIFWPRVQLCNGYHHGITYMYMYTCKWLKLRCFDLQQSTYCYISVILGSSYRCWSWLLVFVGPMVFVLKVLFPSLPASLLLFLFTPLLILPLFFLAFLLLPFLLLGLQRLT